MSEIIEGIYQSLGNFSRNIEYQLQLNALRTTAEYVEDHLSCAKAVFSRTEIYDHAFKNISVENGLYCEFGVYEGHSINYLARQAPDIIHGFDSFQGLPQFWRSGYEVGAFKMDCSQLPDLESNVQLHIGLFENTLPEFVKSHSRTAALIHIDCDLYASTQTVLEALEPNIGIGTVLIFDEYFNYSGWQNHEFKAFKEFVATHGINYQYLCYNAQDQQVALQILTKSQKK